MGSLRIVEGFAAVAMHDSAGTRSTRRREHSEKRNTPQQMRSCGQQMRGGLVESHGAEGLLELLRQGGHIALALLSEILRVALMVIQKVRR